MIRPTRLDMERAEAEKLQERTDYMLNAALLQVAQLKAQLGQALRVARQYKARLERCEAFARRLANRANVSYTLR